MFKKTTVAATLVAAAMGASTAMADGFLLDMDPGTNFQLYSQNTNDGYAGFRGMVFVADEAIVANGAYLYTASSNGLNAVFNLWEVENTEGNVLDGANLVASTDAFLQGSLDFHGAKFSPVTLQPGQAYLLQVGYDEAADQNWFFDFDPNFFGDPPVDIGPITLIDGTAGGDTGNFVAPRMGLQYVPGPSALALLGLGLVGARRRRR